MPEQVNYRKIIETRVTNGQGFNNHMDDSFKSGRESTFLIQLSLGYRELEDFDRGSSRFQTNDRGTLRQDVRDLSELRSIMDRSGLAGFYMRLQTPEDVLGALRDYQASNFNRGFHGS